MTKKLWFEVNEGEVDLQEGSYEILKRISGQLLSHIGSPFGELDQIGRRPNNEVGIFGFSKGKNHCIRHVNYHYSLDPLFGSQI